MNFYLLMPLAACLACLGLAVGILARDSTRPASRVGAAVALSGAWWACCEVLWNTASNPHAAILLVRLSSIGWMMIGPLILHLFLELTSHPVSRKRWLMPALYVLPLAFAMIDMTTSWIHPTVVRTSWGWGWSVRPLFIVPYAVSAGTVTVGLLVAYGSLRDSSSPGERRQTKWMFGGLMIPLLVASFTDGLAPLLGVQLPRLGAASITLLVISVAWTFHRYGYSLLAPGAFASEILATLREGVALLRLGGTIHSANAGLGRMLGISPRELEGRAIAELIDVALPAPDDRVAERECSLLPPDREPVPVSICVSLLRDKQENPIGLVLVARDLREIASLRSRLITSGRLASVGQLAAGIAHEINNPVAYVRANLGSLSGILKSLASQARDPENSLLREELREGYELIEESQDGIDRVAAIVRDVKGFSHAGSTELEVTDIHAMLESVLRVAGPQLKYGAPVVRSFGEIRPVRGSSQQLKQVFLNLVINASQAVSEHDEIRIVTRCEGDRVIVEVQDDGCGIPPDLLDRVFDPFFTTKPVGEGTGLGLSISYQIVETHGGELSVTSEPGIGTCVRVALPVADLDTPER